MEQLFWMLIILFLKLFPMQILYLAAVKFSHFLFSWSRLQPQLRRPVWPYLGLLLGILYLTFKTVDFY